MIDWAEETGIRRTAIRVIFAGTGYGRRLNRKKDADMMFNSMYNYKFKIE